MDEIGTDPELATLMFEAETFHQWVEDSFFGQNSWAAPALGYVAPPMDGVWATAPYLHNGSIPTIEALLNSHTRPDCWTWSYDSTDYNTQTLGWNFQESHCHKDELNANQRAFIYDSSNSGYGNQGHLFGDHLSETDRSAVIEYLKTL